LTYFLLEFFDVIKLTIPRKNAKLFDYFRDQGRIFLMIVMVVMKKRPESGFATYDHGRSYSSTATYSSNAKRFIKTFESIVACYQNPGTTDTCGMTEGNRTAVDVKFCTIPLQRFFIGQYLDGKSFIDLYDVDIIKCHSGIF